MKARFVLVPDDVVTASFEIGKCVIRLDETTMKRIAKYNLNEEFKDINNKIKDAKYKSKCLDDELEMKRKKLEAMDKLIDAIWKDEDFEEDNYFPKDDEWGEDD
jgi:predicted nuclease with TOPRIM domain